MDIVKAKDILTDAQAVLIATHEHPTPDAIGSALALYLGLAGMGKKVTVVCPDPIVVGLSDFIGADKITTEMAQKNFVISLDYQEGSIEKVSYNIEGSTFNLVIEPRPGFEPFSQDKVHYSHQGAAPAAIITVDTIHLGGLKKLYESQKELFAAKPIINIDRHPNNAQYGAVNLVDAKASSTAELVAQLLAELGIALTADSATNLLNALYGATNSFSNPAVTATAFELAAACLKSGGKRFSAPNVEEEEIVRNETVVAPTGEAPMEWLKPKIFKSSTS